MPSHQLTKLPPAATPSLAPARAWHQYNIIFPDRCTAEQIAISDLLPALTSAQDAGLLHYWWFIRKQPWKLRYLPDDDSHSTVIAGLLGKLATRQRITRWTTGVYEPEMTAFGGDEAMDTAHRLFHLDSRSLLTRAARPAAPVGQREITVLLCSALLRAAGLDWYEQGDVWAQVGRLRPGAATLTPGQAAHLTSAMHRLMTADAQGLCREHGPLGGYDGWINAFEQAGQCLAALAGSGKLDRGLRAILAHHVIFHANRAGLSVGEQANLAALAARNVFGAGDGPAIPHNAGTAG